MPRSQRFRFYLVWSAAAAAFPACGQGDGLNRQAIHGTVTLDGKALPKGLIQFQPDSESVPVAAGAAVSDGKYSIPREQGPVPGKYKVTISADAGKPVAMVDGMPGGAGTPNKELIPAKYNAKSTLTAEVKAGGPAEFPFELKSR